MDTLNLEFITSLPKNHQSLYKGMAFDGQYFYLVIPTKNIIFVMNDMFQLIRQQKVARPYSNICYNNKKKCFFVSDAKKQDYIYQLDEHLEEINDIHISEQMKTNSKILDISYNSLNDTLMIVYKNFILETNENGEIQQTIVSDDMNTYCCILAISTYYITIICSSKGKQYLSLLTTNGGLINQYYIPNNYKIEDIAIIPNCNNKLAFFILATKCSCQSCILHCIIDIKKCPCNCCKWTNECCDSCIDQSICDILESIALQETALSHILNAEGEKLQKAITITKNICELIEINKSINTTITNIILLENVLYTKLSTLQNLCSLPCECKNINE